jgi:hypothetical protein
MSLQEPVLESVGECLRELRLATELWNAADLPRVRECQETLESVARKMADAESLLRNAPGRGSAKLRPQVLELKTEALRIERLVDASAAFFRAAFPTAGGGSPVYGSGGHIRVEPAPAGSQGVQG